MSPSYPHSIPHPPSFTNSLDASPPQQNASNADRDVKEAVHGGSYRPIGLGIRLEDSGRDPPDNSSLATARHSSSIDCSSVPSPSTDNYRPCGHQPLGVGAQFTDVASINDNDFERSGNLQDLHSLRKARPFIFPGPPPIFLQHRSFRDGGTVPNSLAAEEQGADGGLGRVVRRPYVIAHSADGNAGPSRRRPHHSSNDNDEQPVAGRNLCFCGAGLLQQFQIRRSLWATSCSMMDTKMTVRFLVVIFNFFLGVAVIFSFKVAPARPDTALPSLDDDSYPIMVAQVAGSLLSPLLFSIVSVKGGLPPLRQRLGSCYFLLLVLGVLMSAVTLLLYVLCPSNYRFTNATMIASLEFTVLGSWQFLEKRWKKASEASVINDDIESGGPRDS